MYDENNINILKLEQKCRMEENLLVAPLSIFRNRLYSTNTLVVYLFVVYIYPSRKPRGSQPL